MQLLQLIGNLGADAKVVDNNGRPFISFNVADTERWKDENNVDHEKTQWVSCAYNGGLDAPILPYLKAGTKVFVMGRQRTRVYSSEKERRMVAGINLSVTHIELVGGQVDDVPRRLVTPTGEIINVYKAFYIAQNDLEKLPDSRLLTDTKGNLFAIDKVGFVTPQVQESTTSEQQQQQHTEDNDEVF